ncbi:J domain-containing protein [Synechococcus sp. GFB01]|uniref:J domain-containing protein n=1 Tax=Synechococcus sp. GFB01 TaxID=1662190 RepID=UPI000A55F4B5|nr:J domain-containing protein [Synechococcus sp. GFB01]
MLGVSRQATAAEIKAAYRALVKRHHPDAGGDDQRILALNAAWEVLGDAESRRRFDRQIGQPHAAGARPRPTPGPQASRSRSRPVSRSSSTGCSRLWPPSIACSVR